MFRVFWWECPCNCIAASFSDKYCLGLGNFCIGCVDVNMGTDLSLGVLESIPKKLYMLPWSLTLLFCLIKGLYNITEIYLSCGTEVTTNLLQPCYNLQQICTDFFFTTPYVLWCSCESICTVALTGGFTGNPQTHKDEHVATREQEKGCMGERLIVLHKVIALFSFQCVTTTFSCLVKYDLHSG